MILLKSILAFSVLIGMAYSAEPTETHRTQSVSSQLFDSSIDITMTVSISKEERLDKISLKLSNFSEHEYRLGVAEDVEALIWGLFITSLEDRSELISKDNLVLDFDSHYVIRELSPEESVDWTIDVAAVVDDAALYESLLAANLQVNMRIWAFKVEDGGEFSYESSSSQTARLLWRGSLIR